MHKKSKVVAGRKTFLKESGLQYTSSNEEVAGIEHLSDVGKFQRESNSAH